MIGRFGTRGEDRCSLNPTFNSYEYRFGGGRAQIIDYLLFSGDHFDQDYVHQGASLDVYFKVLFHDQMTPVPSCALRTPDGLLVYGTSTELLGEDVRPIDAGDYRIFHFSLSLHLAEGDWFLDLGIKDAANGLCDVRRSLAALHVLAGGRHHGLVNLDARFEEVG